MRRIVGARSWAAQAWPGRHRQAPSGAADGSAETEDRVLANGTVFAVADGASHPRHGGVAATLAIAEFALAVAAAPPSFDTRYRVQLGVVQANACVRFYGNHRQYTGMQTTLCGAVVVDGMVVVVSVGDSRIVLIRHGSVLPLLPPTHGLPRSFVGSAADVPTMAMDCFHACDGDRLVAMTDGLDCLSLAEIGDLAGGGQPAAAAEALLRRGHARGDDDVACVVTDLGCFPMLGMVGTPPAGDNLLIKDPLDLER